MLDQPLSLAARVSVTLTALVFAVVVFRVVFRRAPGAGLLVLGTTFAVATLFSYGPLVATLPRLFPVGAGLALAAVLGSLLSPSARRAFDAASDGEVRQLLG